jgi:hypothetical protein
MAKVIVDESELIDDNSLDILKKLANFFDRLDDPYRMPELFAEYYDRQRQGGVDTYYAVNVGYGYDALSLHMTFKKDMLVMEFRGPDGMRLMELRLHK